METSLTTRRQKGDVWTLTNGYIYVILLCEDNGKKIIVMWENGKITSLSGIVNLIEKKL